LQAHIPRLRRYARALTASREAADDLTQETLEHAWRKRALWEPSGSLRAWLFTLMHRRFLNGLRRVPHAEALEGDEAAPSDATPPPGGAESRVVLDELERALHALPGEQRTVVLLVGLEQFSYAETAQVLDVPIGTVMSRLSRGRERLRALLDRGPADAAVPALKRVK
jgi:RNA polymerase sigma-70 factor (ECF subfamily)